MQVTINELSYSPTVFIRNAEMQAIEHLAPSVQDSIIPTFLMKPWGNSNDISNSIKRIEKAFPKRKYFLDVDRYYNRESGRVAWTQFRSLSDSSDGFSNWRNLVASTEWSIPCIQLLGASPEDIASQIDWANEYPRPFAFRIERQFPANPQHIVEAIASVEHSNFLVIIDAGWSRDLIGLQLWASGWISNLVRVNNRIRMIITGSSFPDQFMIYGTYGEEPLQERPLYAALRRLHNAADLVYGDWGSSRPHGAEGGGPGYPRIDLPIPSLWAFFRGANIDGNYPPLALRATRSPLWDHNLNIWGQYIINNTATGVGYTINSAQQAAAARINIHIHRQATSGGGDVGGQVDENYED